MYCSHCKKEMVKTKGNIGSTMAWSPCWKCPGCKKIRRRKAEKGETGGTIPPVLRRPYKESFDGRLDAILEAMTAVGPKVKKYQIVKAGKPIGAFGSVWELKQALIKMTGKDNLDPPGMEVMVLQGDKFVPLMQSEYFRPSFY